MINLDWGKNNQQQVYGVLIFLFYYVVLVLLAMDLSYSYDSYWHLQMGKDFIENGLSPSIDHYSFSYQGKEITSAPILFQIVLALFVPGSNEIKGFILFKIFYLSLLMVFVYFYFRQLKASWHIVFLILPFLAYFISLRMLVRPELISYVLIVMCLSLYIRARMSFTTKELIFICMLLLFWVNYHTPVFGYIIIFGLFIDKAIHKLFHEDNSFSWTQWGLWGLGVFLIGFINPQGQHFFIQTLFFISNDVGKYTIEYMSPQLFFSTNNIVYLSWLLSGYVAIWSLIKKQYGFVFISVFLAYFSLSIARMVTPVAIINFCILAYLFSQTSWPKVSSTLKPFVRNLLLAVLVVLPILPLYSMIKKVNVVLEKQDNMVQLMNKRFPVQVADYLKRHKSGGNILNNMETGGYLINKLSPDYKVYFDGRTNILYPMEFVEHNHNIRSKPDVLTNEIENNTNIQYAVYTNSPKRYMSLSKINRLSLNFADEGFILMTEKSDISFATVSKLMVFPMCWNDQLSEDIQKEISLAKKVFKEEKYTIVSILNLLEDYLRHDSKLNFVSEMKPAALSSDSVKRMAAALALNVKNYEMAMSSFSSIDKPDQYDVLMMAYAMVMNTDYANAENILYFFYSNYVKEGEAMPYNKAAIYLKALQIIQQNSKLNKFPDSYVEDLEAEYKKAYFVENLKAEYKKSYYKKGAPPEDFIAYKIPCNTVF